MRVDARLPTLAEAYGLLTQGVPVPDDTASPLMQGQAAVADRFALNKAAHAADAPKHDYLSFKGTP